MSLAAFGFFHRRGAFLAGSIGSLRARWDRHHGGAQTIRPTRNGSGPVHVATRVRLLREGRPVIIRQEDDPDPRLVICEEGPERIALRVMYSLIDAKGAYHGDGLTDTILYADGEVRLAFGLRLVDGAAHNAATDAWVEITAGGDLEGVRVGTRGGSSLGLAELSRSRSYRFGRGLPGRRVLVEGRRGAAAFGWYSDNGSATDDLGGVGLWHGPQDRSPYYDTWGHLYGQWQGLQGWGASKSGRLVVRPSENGVGLAWHWLLGADQPCSDKAGLKAMIGLFFDADPRTAAQRVADFQNPIAPRAEGAEFRCLDVVENVLLYRKTGREMKLTFPRDRLARKVRVRAFGIDGSGAVVVKANGRQLTPHVLSLGGMTDDPYGPNLARPGDRFVPVIGDLSKGPHHVVFSVGLSARKKTVVTLREGPGINLAYVKWDDRRTYVIRTSSMPARPAATFSTRTLCLHDLRGVPAGRDGADRGPALIRVPLYWYPTNVQTRGECFNELKRLRVAANGPDRLAFEVTSTDPDRRARSTASVEIPAPTDALVVNTTARLKILKPLPLPAIQYLNSFPSNSWQPEDWPDDWIVLVTADGRRMYEPFKKPRDKRRKWDHIRTWRGRLALVQGAADRGNIFVLAECRRPRGQLNGYMLCPVWLDSHFTFEGLKTPLKPGRSFEVRYSIGIHGDRRLSRADAVEIARRAVAAGRLPFE